MKPTIHDLKKILEEPEQPIKIISDGSVRADGKIVVDYCKNCKYWGDVFTMPDDAPEGAKQELQGKYRHCDHEESPVVVSPETFGCVLSIEKPKKGAENETS